MHSYYPHPRQYIVAECFNLRQTSIQRKHRALRRGAPKDVTPQRSGIGGLIGGLLGRGLHSSTSRLNVSTFYGLGRTLRGCLGGGWQVLGGIGGAQGVFCVGNGSG